MPAPSFISPGGTIPFLDMEIESHTESNHDTPLTLAAAGGHDELVRLLLSKGANIEHRDKKGKVAYVDWSKHTMWDSSNKHQLNVI